MNDLIETVVGNATILSAPEITSPQASPVRIISVGAFFDRFGSAKWGILADANPSVMAVIKDASVRKYIDLNNADLPAGLSIVQAAGHAIDASAIINADIQTNESP